MWQLIKWAEHELQITSLIRLSDQIGTVLFQDQNQYNKFATKEISKLYADREQQYILEHVSKLCHPHIATKMYWIIYKSL